MKKLLLLLLLIPINIQAYKTSSTCAILMDMDSKRIIYADDIHTVRSIASITKIMTAIIAIESNQLEDIVIIGDEINDAFGSAIYIKENEELKLIDLIYGLMLRSGNDAALTIAKKVSGNTNDFVIKMNEKAKEIGMKNTVFNNPSGLDIPKSNYSTAYDMALLTSYAMQNEIYRKIVSTKKYKLKTNMNYYIWNNKNKLLSIYKYTTGGKTGFTDIAKRTLVTTASKDNLNLVSVTLNDGNDFNDHKNLFEEAFNNYKNYQILKKGKINILNEKYYPNYDFYIDSDFYYPLMNNETKSIILKFKIDQKKQPNDSEKIGEVIVKLGDKEIYNDSLYIKKKNIKRNFITKIKDWIRNIW